MGWYRRPARALTHRARGLAQTQWRHVETDEAAGVYLTAMDALNLPAGPLGDWHGAIWRPEAGTAASTRTPVTERLCRIGRELWGTLELVDARGALARIGHPAGTAAQPVWAASHPRAVAEMVIGALRSTDSIPNPDPRSAQRWLNGGQRRRCAAMLARARHTLEAPGQRRALDAWIRRLSEYKRMRSDAGS